MFRKIATAVTAAGCAAALWLMLPGAPAGAATSLAHAAAVRSAASSRPDPSPPGVRGAAPPSAYGCNGNTCIEIDGSGTTVNAIFGQTQNTSNNSIKTTGTVYDNGTAIHTFPAVTLKPGGTTTQEWNSPSYKFKSGDQVCVHYSGISGEPCETIG
ncbi:MAG TPA: hypothetical protein VN840_22360 [Streptosporangiaceae bacterium]|nr:hypothetical protein [Streptosporangiaceae bacterium]